MKKINNKVIVTSTITLLSVFMIALTQNKNDALTTRATTQDNITIQQQQPEPTSEVAQTQFIHKIEQETQEIMFATEEREDSNYEVGKKIIIAVGKNGVRTDTYEVTYENEREVSRILTRSEITTPVQNQIVAIGTKQKQVTVPLGATLEATTSSECDKNYSGCVPIASDVDCAGGRGNGPAYVSGPIQVIGIDKYDLDHDNDGIACE